MNSDNTGSSSLCLNVPMTHPAIIRQSAASFSFSGHAVYDRSVCKGGSELWVKALSPRTRRAGTSPFTELLLSRSMLTAPGEGRGPFPDGSRPSPGCIQTRDVNVLGRIIMSRSKDRSRQWRLARSIRLIFQSRFHSLICFSRCNAASLDW